MRRFHLMLHQDCLYSMAQINHGLYEQFLLIRINQEDVEVQGSQCGTRYCTQTGLRIMCIAAAVNGAAKDTSHFKCSRMLEVMCKDLSMPV